MDEADYCYYLEPNPVQSNQLTHPPPTTPTCNNPQVGVNPGDTTSTSSTTTTTTTENLILPLSGNNNNPQNLNVRINVGNGEVRNSTDNSEGSSIKKNKQIILFFVELGMFVCAVLYTVLVIIMQWHSNDSMIMTVCGYISLVMCLSFLGYLILVILYYSTKTFQTTYRRISTFSIVFVFVACITQALIIPTVIYRQATENFIDLFKLLDLGLKIPLILTTMIVVLLAGVLIVKLLMSTKFMCFHKK